MTLLYALPIYEEEWESTYLGNLISNVEPGQKRRSLRIKLGYPAIMSIMSAKDAFTMVTPFWTIQGTQSLRHLSLHSNSKNPVIKETNIESGPVHPMRWISKKKKATRDHLIFFKIFLYVHTSGCSWGILFYMVIYKWHRKSIW